MMFISLVGFGIDHSPPSGTKTKERVDSRYIPQLPLWAFVTCFRVNYIYIYIYTYSLSAQSLFLEICKILLLFTYILIPGFRFVNGGCT